MARVHNFPDPKALGYDWPVVQAAWHQVERLRERLTAAQVAEHAARKAVTTAEGADHLARKRAIAEDKPLPKVSQVQQATNALNEARAVTSATLAALEDAENNLQAAITDAQEYMLADATEFMETARSAYAAAVEALAAARASFTERQGMVLFLRDPAGRYKPSSGYLQNQPGNGQQPAPMFETVVASLRADADKPEAKVEPENVQPLQPTLREMAISPSPSDNH